MTTKTISREEQLVPFAEEIGNLLHAFVIYLSQTNYQIGGNAALGRYYRALNFRTYLEDYALRHRALPEGSHRYTGWGDVSIDDLRGLLANNPRPPSNPQPPPQPERQYVPVVNRGPVLVYRVLSDTAVVFATRADAEHVSAINRALFEAETWGEFRRLLPGGEWDTIAEMLGDCPDDDDDADEMCHWERDDEPFSVDNIPGVGDGDYPPWLQADMDSVIPEDILERYGKRESSVLNGPFWEIPPSNLEPLVDELRAQGFVVEPADDLEFN